MTNLVAVENPDIQMTKGSYLSEAVLWVKWHHRGFLKSETDISLLTIDATTFYNHCVCSTSLCVSMRRYAAEFARAVQMFQDMDDYIAREQLTSMLRQARGCVRSATKNLLNRSRWSQEYTGEENPKTSAQGPEPVNTRVKIDSTVSSE